MSQRDYFPNTNEHLADADARFLQSHRREYIGMACEAIADPSRRHLVESFVHLVDCVEELLAPDGIRELSDDWTECSTTQVESTP